MEDKNKIKRNIDKSMKPKIAENQDKANKIDAQKEVIQARRAKREEVILAKKEKREAERAKTHIKKTDTTFELQGKVGSPITITSSEEIKASVRYYAREIKINIESSKNAKTTEISISGFAKTIHKYDNSHANYEMLIAGEDGKVTFKQDISKAHTLTLKLNKGTLTLTNSGWDNPTKGTWNPVTRVAKITTNTSEDIVIEANYVTVDGLQANNTKYLINGFSQGITVYGYNNVTISNFEITNCDTGIDIEDSNYITIKDCIIRGTDAGTNYVGIDIYNVRNFNISNNQIVDRVDEGIYAYEYNSFGVIEKNIITTTVGEYGIYLYENNNSNKIINNTIEKNNGTGDFYGIYFEDYYNNYNLIKDNTISIDTNNITSNNIELSGIYFDDYYNSYNNILNNIITISNNSLNYSAGSLSTEIYGIYLYNDNSGNNVVRYNTVSINKNVITISGNNYMSNYIYGIEVNDEYVGGDICEYNKVYIKDNKMVSSAGASNSLYTEIYGIISYYYNGGIKVNRNEVQISGNLVIGTFASASSEVSGIVFYDYICGSLMENNKITIKDNTLADDGEYYGIYLDEYSNGNLINSNTVIITGNTGSSLTVYGIYLYYENSGNKILNNILSNNQGIGIYFDGSSGANESNIIQNNIITSNKGHGIYFLEDNDYNDIINNNISNNQLDGIYFDYYNDYCRIEYNTISKNVNGIYLNDSTSQDNDTNTIKCNKIQYNSGYGIFIGAYNPDNVILSNTIIKNANGLFIQLNSDGNVIEFNNFIKGTGYNAYDANALNVNSFYSNYWSNWSGVAPYYVNGLVGGPEDPSPSKVRLNKCRRVIPVVEAKPIKMPYKCNHARQHYKCEKYEKDPCDKRCKK
ncbi:NosD domain-containing protein [Clostridioides difficile]